jgi:hypothetical protein
MLSARFQQLAANLITTSQCHYRHRGKSYVTGAAVSLEKLVDILRGCTQAVFIRLAENRLQSGGG